MLTHNNQQHTLTKLSMFALLATLIIPCYSQQPLEKLIDIGGYKLHLHTTGNGAPTVILDTFLGGNLLEWSLVQPQVAQFATVCSYDRAGLGLSELSPYRRTSDWMAKELHTLWLTLQKDLVAQSTKSKQIFAPGCGHMIQRERPDIIVETIKEMVELHNISKQK